MGRRATPAQLSIALNQQRARPPMLTHRRWPYPNSPRPALLLLQGLRGSIPPNFPYLHVEFGIADGFVHVVDDEAEFDRGLARSVMIGARRRHVLLYTVFQLFSGQQRRGLAS